MKKIYIIGPVGSGKTTFSKQLSKKYNITSYELDKIIWNDEEGNIKRSKKEAKKLFNRILTNDLWIIEDVGRNLFLEGRKKADIIYYIKFPKIKSYYRVIKRWIKQKIGLEIYNCPPTFKELIYLLLAAHSYYKKEKDILNELMLFKDKLIFVDSKKNKYEITKRQI